MCACTRATGQAHHTMQVCASVLTVPASAHHTPGSLDHVIKLRINKLVGLPQDIHQLLGLLAVAASEECVRCALAAGPCCAANAVDIVLGLCREVVVDHISYILDIYRKQQKWGNRSTLKHGSLELGMLTQKYTHCLSTQIALSHINVFTPTPLSFTHPSHPIHTKHRQRTVPPHATPTGQSLRH